MTGICHKNPFLFNFYHCTFSQGHCYSSATCDFPVFCFFLFCPSYFALYFLKCTLQTSTDNILHPEAPVASATSLLEVRANLKWCVRLMWFSKSGVLTTSAACHIRAWWMVVLHCSRPCCRAAATTAANGGAVWREAELLCKDCCSNFLIHLKLLFMHILIQHLYMDSQPSQVKWSGQTSSEHKRC